MITVISRLFRSVSQSRASLQVMLALGLVVMIAGLCFLFREALGYRTVALIMLMTVSFGAMFFQLYAVIVAAIFSALIWNYFFIPPIYTFHISTAEDILLFSMYFIIALVHGSLTFKIRSIESNERDRVEKEKTIKLYNQILQSLSHEIRTPLSAIVGAIDTLRENQNNFSADQNLALLHEMDLATSRLNRQVDNLLNMSRLESGILELKKDWFDLEELLSDLIKKHESIAENRQFTVTLSNAFPLVKIDRGIIETVLDNLILNAIQYTPDHSTIALKAEIKQGVVILVIADNGPGFPESSIDLVFEKFYRLPKSKAGGTGLGLSIAKGFTELHGGSIRLSNAKPHGAYFEINLPVEITYLGQLKNE